MTCTTCPGTGVITSDWQTINCPECNPVYNVSGPDAPESAALVVHCEAVATTVQDEMLSAVISGVNYAEILGQIPMAEIVKYMNETE